jgi:hypothetical protein
MTKNQTLMTALAEPFPVEMEKTLVKSGMSLVYLPVSEVINRLNKVLGPESWSFTVISIERDQYDNDEIIAHINLSIDFGDGKIVNKHGIGGQSVKRAKSTGKPIDLGNDFKGAVSDALKKAAQQLGVGLYLARSADAMDIEDAMDADLVNKSTITAQQNISPEVSQKWENFMSIVKSLSSEKKSELNAYWDKASSGQPKPRKETITPDALDGLIAEATRLSFGGGTIIDGE